jgi:rubrerythrin
MRIGTLWEVEAVEQAVKVLDFAMKMELQARDFYLESLDEVKLETTKQLLAYLAEWEKGHYDFLKKQKESVEGNSRWDTSAEPSIDEKEGEKIVSSKKEGTPVEPPIDELTGDMAILRIALVMETDFHNFYKNAAKNMKDEEGRKVLEMLAEWESGHQQMINEQYSALHKDFMAEMGFEPF